MVPLALAVMAAPRGHVEFATQQRLDPYLPDFLIKIQHTEKSTVVSDGHCRHLQFLDPANQILGADGPIEKTICRVDVEMDKF
jgi:hypothetical protein